MRPPLIALLCAYGFTITISQGAFPALLPEVGSVVGLPDWQLGLVAGAFGFARLISAVPVGLLVTHHLRPALLAAPVLLAAGVLLVGAGGPFPVLLLGRLTMGIAHGLAVVGGLTAILRHQAAGALGSALNAFELSAMLGILGGTLLLGSLSPRLAWNQAFLVTCAPLVLGLAVLPVLLGALPRETAHAAGRPLFARRASSGAPPPAVTLGVVLAFAAGATAALVYATMEQFAIPLRGAREFGLDRRGVTRLLVTVQLTDIACLLPVGTLGDRLGATRVLGITLLAFSAGAALIAFGSFSWLIMGCVLFGLGMTGWTLPLALLRRDTPAEHIGWRTALYRVGVDGGMFLGPVLSGALAVSLPGLTPAAGAAVLGVLALLMLRQRRAATPPPV